MCIFMLTGWKLGRKVGGAVAAFSGVPPRHLVVADESSWRPRHSATTSLLTGKSSPRSQACMRPSRVQKGTTRTLEPSALRGAIIRGTTWAGFVGREPVRALLSSIPRPQDAQAYEPPDAGRTTRPVDAVSLLNCAMRYPGTRSGNVTGEASDAMRFRSNSNRVPHYLRDQNVGVSE
jgi:hypothetical protein